MVQTSNILVKAKSKDRDLCTLPFKPLRREALHWLTYRYTLLLPFRVASVDKKRVSVWTELTPSRHTKSTDECGGCVGHSPTLRRGAGGAA